jgi:hypothetical protein
MAVPSTRLRLFIIEAPSPMDLLQQRAEAPALEKACSLIGHEVTSFIAKSKAELRTACRFISSIDSDQDRHGRSRVPLCVHIAAHGNEDELAFGQDSVTWADLLEILQPLCQMPTYDGDVIIVISACKAADQKLTGEFAGRAIRDSDFRPPLYLFVTADEAPTFAGALVSWTVFYHQLPNASLDTKEEIQEVLDRVQAAGATTLRYYRWEKSERRYRRYTPKPLG